MKKTLVLSATIFLAMPAYADVCKPAQTACTEPTTQLDFCKGEFEVSEIATKYVTACDSKLRRFNGTLATRESRDRFFCKCLFQAKTGEWKDP